ncbi:MAG: response regulator [Bacteroidales bacterium]|nr:response regulator [Bacteroidales bacterium]MDD4672483.1 response regulator [Bacteroidales bacterium]MDY0347242.1 response regulator [Tenuifilaceae bacterium]
MNIANRILKIFSSSKTDNTSSEHEMQLQAMRVSFSITTLFFITLAAFLFATSQIIYGIISLCIAVLAIISMVVSAKKILSSIYLHVYTVASSLGFVLLIGIKTIPVVGMIGLGLLPLITMAALGLKKGTYYALFVVLIYIIAMFIPFGFLAEFQNTGLSYQILSIILFAAVLIFVTLHDTIRTNQIRKKEKEHLDLKNSLKLKEDFIANLSHQIRTPLNNIMVVADILEGISDNEKQKDMIDTIHASTNNLVNVVNSMVEISNIDIKERDSVNINFNLRKTISSTIKLFSTLSSSQTAFSLKIDESVPENLIGDPVRIKQILLNLIESILKNRSSSKLNIKIIIKKVKETKDSIGLLVELRSDKPILLPLNENHNLFVTNESALTSASTQMYIDLLELSITQKLIESNQGKLSVTLSAEDAVFSFPYTLNIDSGEPMVKEIKSKPKQSTETDDLMPKPTAVELENASVLLVEDNLINQKIVVLSLKKLVKNIEIANNGKEALDRFGTSRFDIILMDIQMPIMNGIVATKKIREIESNSNFHIPIIAITANALLGDKEECLAAGMDDYISKPFQIEILIQKMKKLLGDQS